VDLAVDGVDPGRAGFEHDRLEVEA
jgi:hypothetical protein